MNYQALKCRNGGRRNAMFEAMTPKQINAYWKGYDAGYRVGSQRDKVAALQSQILFLQNTIRKLTT